MYNVVALVVVGGSLLMTQVCPAQALFPFSVEYSPLTVNRTSAPADGKTPIVITATIKDSIATEMGRALNRRVEVALAK